jgi:hypothetical protein
LLDQADNDSPGSKAMDGQVHKMRWYQRILRLALVVSIFVLIIGVHFRGLWGTPLRESIWGISISADPVGVISETFEAYTQLLRGCGNRVVSHSFPFGQELPPLWSSYLRPQWLVMGSLLWLTGLPVLSYNLSILMFFLLNYAVTYLVVRRFVNHWYVALIPAVLLTFSVYAYAHSWAHLGLLPLFVFPLFFACLSLFLETGYILSAVGAGLAAGLALYTSPYYFYFLFWVGLVVLLVHLLCTPKFFLKAHVPLRAMSLVVILFVVMIPFLRDQYFFDYSSYWESPEVARDYGNNLEMILAFTARPKDYLFSNIHHFMFGNFWASLIEESSRYRSRYSDELPIYLGLGPIVFMTLLLIRGFLQAFSRQSQRGLSAKINRFSELFFFARDQGNRKIFLSCLILALVAFLLSLAPTLNIFGFEVLMPNEFLRRILPFRSYARFAVVVLMALSIVMALVVDRTRYPWLWTLMLILVCAFESTPETLLHPASRDLPYIKFLREQPEKVMMRFERQNMQVKRAVDLEALLAEKYVMNGSVNDIFGLTEWPLFENLEWPFMLGHLRDMGVELLIVTGQLRVSSRDQNFVERIAVFSEENIEIWRLKPSGQKAVAPIFQDLISKRKSDFCYVASKAEVKSLLQSYWDASKM